MTGRLLRLVLADRRRFVLVGVLPAVVLTVLAAVVSRSDRLAGPDVAPPSVAPQVVAAAPAPLGGPVVVATRFAQYWVDTADPAGWLDRLRPLATDEFGGVVLPRADPASVPATRVTGPARELPADTGAAIVLVPLDTMTLRVELVDTGRGWRVSDAARADPAPDH
ncbi:hypothetical protein ACFQ34_33195 [Pseudonocardia benzenivorans]|uniref:Mce-associated membrane protein n=1 Tax=Pseudonocardia benzenivorans TaxID=228005 RepID=A0ABW3VTY7_9PSEU|nr:hypothetical protein PSD17_45520 [Pseudonocardia sp. D17]